MADLGYVRSLIRGIPDEKTRSVLDQVMTHVLENIRLGVPDHQTRATNLQAYWQESTTATSTGEFSVAHGLPSAPNYAIPVLALGTPGSKAGFLTVSRAADARRIYVKCDAGSTAVPFVLLVE